MSAQQPPEKLGKYKIVRELGKGAMGVVYEGIDPIIGRRVAIKTARRDVMEASGRADEMMQRFLREARAAGMLNDPGIITIYDADEENGIAYIAMEFIDSGNLQDYLAHRGRPSPEEAVEIGAQICKALALAHAQGIVHRDIKPANIMMLSDGTVKIADFGIAHVSDSNLTQEGAMIGTPHYMSPEQFMGHKIDGRSDLFSVALIVYEMLTGEKPFTGEVLSTVMHKVIKVDPVEPKELNFAVNECLSKVIMKALSKNPAQRYPTGVAMAAALMESLKAQPDPAITGVGPCGRSAASTDATVMAGEADATVVSSHLPDHAATVATGPQRSAAATPTIALGGQPSGQPAQPAAPSKRSLTIPAVAGAAVLAIIIAAAGLFMSGRGGNTHETSPASTPTSVQPGMQTTPSSLPSASTEPAIEKIDFQVWLADTKEAFDAATDGDFTQCNPNGVADITVTDRKTGETLADESKVDSVRTQLAKPSPAIQVLFKQPGYIETKREYSATKAKDVCKDVIVLRKEGL
ncbi:MAG TPA: protein kinase [Candidatus Hydrogenedentes bacterium]|mgnify:FL=1|nr:protein kinase [Candidatus Hydrogenedentota bacterium]HRT20157.1 protein kinase [Candidatus Hydrogenedentota bacterium]HRT63191.1 protein kinase [Candidatus Hydrogenedentota bacterium]